MAHTSPEGRSIPELLSEALAQLGKLMQNEMSLARAELADKASQAATGIGLVAAGAVLLVPALVLFLMALAAYLIQIGLSPVTAYLLSGCLAAIGSAALAFIGMGRLKPASLSPQVTLRQVQKDVAAAKESIR